MEVNDVNCLICCGECGPSSHVIGESLERSSDEFLGPLCQLYNLSEGDCQNSGNCDLGCCHSCLEDLTRVGRILQDLKNLKEQLANVKGVLDKRIVESNIRERHIKQIPSKLRKKLIENIETGSGGLRCSKTRILSEDVEDPSEFITIKPEIGELDSEVDFSPPCTPNYFEPDFQGREIQEFNEFEDLRSQCLKNRAIVLLERQEFQSSSSKGQNLFKKKKTPPKSHLNTCHICSQTLLTHKSLQKHLRIRHSKLKDSKGAGWTCSEPNCGKTYKSKGSLKGHFEAVHTQHPQISFPPEFDQTELAQEIYKAFQLDPAIIGPLSPHLEQPPGFREMHRGYKSISNKETKWTRLIPKEFAHLGLNYSQYRYLTILKTRLDTKPETLARDCCICGQRIQFYKLLSHHIYSAHIKDGKFHCPELSCSLQFEFQEDLTAHLRIHRSGKVACPWEGCGKLLKEWYLPQHVKCHEETPQSESSFNCPHCASSFRNKINLSTHIRGVHAKELPYAFNCTAPGCGLGFKTKGFLQRHLRVHETRDSNALHMCEQCGKSYKLKGQLTMHIRRSHLNIRPCVCSTCGKAFHTPAILLIHEKKHMNPEEKKALAERSKIPCHICGLMLSGTISLKNHIKFKHQSTKDFICEVGGCGRSFNVNSARMIHYSIHLNPSRPEFNAEFAEKCPQSLLDYIEKRKLADQKYKQTKRSKMHNV